MPELIGLKSYLVQESELLLFAIFTEVLFTSVYLAHLLLSLGKIPLSRIHTGPLRSLMRPRLCPGFLIARHHFKNEDTWKPNWISAGKNNCLPFGPPVLFQVGCLRQSARGWCTGMTQRDGMGMEEGGGHMYTHGRFISMCGKTHHNTVK